MGLMTSVLLDCSFTKTFLRVSPVFVQGSFICHLDCSPWSTMVSVYCGGSSSLTPAPLLPPSPPPAPHPPPCPPTAFPFSPVLVCTGGSHCQRTERST